MQQYKLLLDNGCTDAWQVPDQLQQLALCAVAEEAARCAAGEIAVFVPFPTSKAGKPVLMQALLESAISKLAEPMRSKVKVLPALQRTHDVQQRSAVGQGERSSLAQDHVDTLVFDSSVRLPLGNCRYIIADDTLTSGGSVVSGMC
jgi:hypothetical protein